MKSRAELDKEPRTMQFELSAESVLIDDVSSFLRERVRKVFPISVWVGDRTNAGVCKLACGCTSGYLLLPGEYLTVAKRLRESGLPATLKDKNVYVCEHMGRLIE